MGLPIPTLIGIASGLSLDSHPKDTERLGRNQIAYAKAIAGDDEALHFLLYRSGSPDRVNGYIKYDSSYQGNLGSADPNKIPVKGWPTGKTRDDAKRKYDAALSNRARIGQTLTDAGQALGGSTVVEKAGQFVKDNQGLLLAGGVVLVLGAWWFLQRA